MGRLDALPVLVDRAYVNLSSWNPDLRLPLLLQIGFMAGGGLLGLMLLKGFNWQALFYAVSAAAVAQSAILFALVPADSPYSLSPATEDASDAEVRKVLL